MSGAEQGLEDGQGMTRLHSMRKCTTQISKGKVFQAESTTGARALGQEHTWCI